MPNLLRPKIVIQFIILFLIGSGIVTGVYLVQQRQEIRREAKTTLDEVQQDQQKYPSFVDIEIPESLRDKKLNSLNNEEEKLLYDEINKEIKKIKETSLLRSGIEYRTVIQQAAESLPVYDLFIVFTQDGKPITPDLDLLVTPSFVDNDLNYTFDDSLSPDDQTILNNCIDSNYPSLRSFYGPPAFSNDVLVKKVDIDESFNAFYYSTTNELHLNENLFEIDVTFERLCSIFMHESAHAFHDDFGIRFNFWEEGMAETSEHWILGLMRNMSTIPWVSEAGSGVSGYFNNQVNQWQGNFHGPQYFLGSYTFKRIIVQNRKFFSDFNLEFYRQLGNLNEQQIIATAGNIVPIIEERYFHDWYYGNWISQPNILNEPLFLGMLPYERPLIIGTFDFQGVSKSIPVEATLEVYDSAGVKIFEQTKQPLSPLYTLQSMIDELSSRDYKGILKFVLKSDTETGIMTDVEYSIFADSLFGLFGVVASGEDGILEIEAVDDSFQTFTTVVSSGYFVAPELQNVIAPLRFTFTSDDGDVYTQGFNKHAEHTFFILHNEIDLEASQGQITTRAESAWLKFNANIVHGSFVFIENDDGSIIKSNKFISNLIGSDYVSEVYIDRLNPTTTYKYTAYVSDVYGDVITIEGELTTSELPSPPCDSYGDVNLDGFITEDDVVLALKYFSGDVDLTPEQIKNTDVNNDEVVDLFDISLISKFVSYEIDSFPVCTILTTPGDADGDDDVDIDDYLIWISQYLNYNPIPNADPDFNNDQEVDGDDFLIWMNNYGS